MRIWAVNTGTGLGAVPQPHWAFAGKLVWKWETD